MERKSRRGSPSSGWRWRLVALFSVLSGGAQLDADDSPLYLETLFGRKPAAGIYMTADQDGHFFLGDYFYNQVCLYTFKAGSRVIAGSGVAGLRDGTGTSAQFYGCGPIARAPSGELFVADIDNFAIRKVTMDGKVTTLAGGKGGPNDGVGTAAQFSYLNGIALDPQGNLFVTDDRSLRKVTQAGNVTTLMRHVSGPNGVATVPFLPMSMTLDLAQNPCVADFASRKIRRFEADGRLTTIASFPPNVVAMNNLAVDARGVLHAMGRVPEEDYRVWRLEATGSWKRLGAPGYQVLTTNPERELIVFAPDGVWKIQEDGTFGRFGPASQPTQTDGEGPDVTFDNPAGIATDANGNIYVSAGHRIRKIDSRMVVTTLAGSEAGFVDGRREQARFREPFGLATDRAGNVYVADYRNHAIRVIRTDDSVATLAGDGTPGKRDGPAAQAQFDLPQGICVDSKGAVYVADSNRAIRKITNGVVSSIDFQSVLGLMIPSGVAIDAQDRLFVSDVVFDGIARRSPTGGFDWLAGNWSEYGFADGQGTAARFDQPFGITVDRDGYIYATDRNNGAIRSISPTGFVRTIAGNGDRGFRDGLYWRGACNAPLGIAIDREGNLLIADAYNSTIRKGYRVSPAATEPTTRWPVPAPLRPGTALSDAQLNATAATPGSFDYMPAPGTILGPGAHLVTAHFTPTDRRNFLPTYASTWVVVAEASAPAIAVQPQDSTAAAGEDVTFTAIAATTGATTYRWQHWERATASWSDLNDAPRYSGTATATLRLQRATPLDDGERFRLLVTDSHGTTATESAQFSIRGGFLVNISTRAFVGGGDQAVIAGFVVTGTETKQVLVRAAGPALAAFGIGGTIPDPRLRVFRGTTEIATNTAWGSAANPPAIRATATQVGAFQWSEGSRDSAILLALAPGQYTAEVSSANGATGVTLVEIYGAEKTAANPIINLSSRSNVRLGENGLTAGFVIQGTQAKKVLIRATGPSLATLFGLGGTLPDPMLRVYTGQQLIVTQAGWSSNTAEISAAAARAAAFSWPAGSKDSAVLLQLQPGAYSAEIVSARGASGIALIEVYDAEL